MKILLVGSGGREHAIAWKLAKSEKVSKVFVAPGNGGTATTNKCENVNITDLDEQEHLYGEYLNQKRKQIVDGVVSKVGIV